MSDDIGGVWRTVGGRRIFIKDGEDLETAMKKSGKFDKNGKKNIIDYTKEAEKIKNNIKELEEDKYSDGTYNIDSKEVVEFETGYQATFQQLNDNYSDKDFVELVEKYKGMTDGKAYAGKFGGSPEISFHFENEKDAIEICQKYNQVSYWDWNKMEEIKNTSYRKGKGNDYD